MPPSIKRSYQRNEAIRTPQDAGKVYLSFSFRYLHENLPAKNPQSITSWEGDGLLLPLLNSLKHLSQQPLPTLVEQKLLGIYDSYPPANVTDFKCPDNLPQSIKWGALRNIGGQKKRVAGFILDQVFYIVFLDKDHQFWKSGLKNT